MRAYQICLLSLAMKPQDKKKQKKKDPLEEVIEILEGYKEGCVPRDEKDYEM